MFDDTSARKVKEFLRLLESLEQLCKIQVRLVQGRAMKGTHLLCSWLASGLLRVCTAVDVHCWESALM